MRRRGSCTHITILVAFKDFRGFASHVHGFVGSPGGAMASGNLWEGVFTRYKPASSVWEIRKVQRGLRYAGLYVLFAGVTFFYTNVSTRAGVPRVSQTYSTYPAGTDILFDATELYKSAIGNIFEEEDWGPLEYAIMAKHFERQGKTPYMHHSQYMTHLLSNGQMKGPF